MQTTKGVCYICGNNRGYELHHVFGGRNRKKSDRYGLMVYLCHQCHNEPPNGVHFNANNAKRLKAEAQRVAMESYKWDCQKFLEEFGKNYDSERNDYKPS